MRVGLVLGAGGVQGGAWLTGALDALSEGTGWDPASADFLVGTSAGSMIAALCASGVPPWFMVAHSRGESFEGVRDAEGRPASAADRSGGAVFRLHRGMPSIGPGSWSLLWRTLSRPDRHTPAALLSAWLPRGPVSTEPLSEQVRRVVPSGWGPHPGLRIVACDYATGRRVAFGSPAAPSADLADAVASSCAIPGFYRSVEIGNRQYVDGGVYSASNADLLRREGLDLVICLNPTSSLHPVRALGPGAATRLLLHRASGRRLGREAKKLRAAGAEVVLIQPLEEDLRAMSVNLMSTRNRNEVIEVARMTVAEQIERPENRQLLAELPRATRPEKVRRPAGPPSKWPPLDLLATPPIQPATA
ncbi:MAG: patatin-like phospholipase family protein [Solirubrobacterales bacterium]